MAFIENEPGYADLRAQYQDDLHRAGSAEADVMHDWGAVFRLPNEAWARRIVGVMGNYLAKQYPDRAHALLVYMGDGQHRISVRAPYRNKAGADELCRRFASGGGRKAAAGINQLRESMLDQFIDAFQQQFGG